VTVVLSRLVRATALLVPLALPLAARAAGEGGVPPPGTLLVGTFDHSMDSRTSDVLEPFTLVSVASEDRTYRGGRVFGHVTRVVKATKNTRGEIDFVFDAYISSSGRSYPIQGRATDLRVPAKRDVPPVPLGVFGTGVVALKPGADVIVPPNTIVQVELTP
jgi:hypothetical protein